MNKIPTFFKSGLGSLIVVIVVAMFLPSAYSQLDNGFPSTPTPSATLPISKPALPVSYATPNAASPLASPMASPMAEEPVGSAAQQFWVGASLLVGDGVERYIWDDTAVDFSGFGLVPVSLTVGNYDGYVRMYAEFTNITDETLIVPMLDFEAVLDGKGFGTQRAWGDTYEVLPGESATFTGRNFYDGALLLSDWETFTITFVEYSTSRELSAQGLRLEVDENRLYNDSDSDKSNIIVEGTMRDSSGVYVGMCNIGTIRATVPAGLFVRIPDDFSLNLGPVSSCARHGASDFTGRLGTGPVSTTEFVLVIPRP